MYKQNICITYELIWAKAKRILENLNETKLENEKVELNFSNCWLFKFKKQNSFKKNSLFRESEDVKI